MDGSEKTLAPSASDVYIALKVGIAECRELDDETDAVIAIYFLVTEALFEVMQCDEGEEYFERIEQIFSETCGRLADIPIHLSPLSLHSDHPHNIQGRSAAKGVLYRTIHSQSAD